MAPMTPLTIFAAHRSVFPADFKTVDIYANIIKFLAVLFRLLFERLYGLSQLAEFVLNRAHMLISTG
jgi:hypothetical protein